MRLPTVSAYSTRPQGGVVRIILALDRKTVSNRIWFILGYPDDFQIQIPMPEELEIWLLQSSPE